MRSGVHTIFAHAPPICVLTIICSAGRGRDLAGGADSSNGFGSGRASSLAVLRQHMGRHSAPAGATLELGLDQEQKLELKLKLLELGGSS